MWAVGNVMVIPVINRIGYVRRVWCHTACCRRGVKAMHADVERCFHPAFHSPRSVDGWMGRRLGLGILLWSAGNLIIPYFIGRFGAFGMPPEAVSKPLFSIFGVVFGFLALLANLFIKPSVEDTSVTRAYASDNDELRTCVCGQTCWGVCVIGCVGRAVWGGRRVCLCERAVV